MRAPRVRKSFASPTEPPNTRNEECPCRRIKSPAANFSQPPQLATAGLPILAGAGGEPPSRQLSVARYAPPPSRAPAQLRPELAIYPRRRRREPKLPAFDDSQWATSAPRTASTSRLSGRSSPTAAATWAPTRASSWYRKHFKLPAENSQAAKSSSNSKACARPAISSSTASGRPV